MAAKKKTEKRVRIEAYQDMLCTRLFVGGRFVAASNNGATNIVAVGDDGGIPMLETVRACRDTKLSAREARKFYDAARAAGVI